MLAHFYFTRPFWFLALLPVIFLLWWQLTVRREEVWQKVCDPHLLPHLLVNVKPRQKYVALVLLGLGWLLTILALAGPTWSKSPQSLYRSQLATVLILDLSRSMDAQDISPSRLSRARHKMWEILKRAQEGQTALLVFAGDVHIVSPLTDDAATIASLIPALNTDLMPLLGTQTHLALQKTGELLERAGKIILITDGLEDIKKSLAAAHRLKFQGHQLSILGVGTDEGAPIPLKKGGFIKDKQGLIVHSRLETEMLIALAKAGGGVYSALTTDNSDLKKLLKLSRFDSGSELMNQQGGQDQGYWLLLLLLPLAALSFRRGWLSLLLVGIIIGSPQPAYAINWDDLWLRSDQQGARALEKNAEAAHLFHSPEWKGVAYYRARQYQKAADAFKQLNTALAHYNRGNALAFLGKLEEAIIAYQKALKKNPQHIDAKHNLDIVKRARKHQNVQQSEDKDKKEDKKEDEKKGGGKTEEEAPENSKKSAADTPPTDKPIEAEDAPILGGENAQSNKKTNRKNKPAPPLEQWLQSIPDNPSELLRRKFRLKHQRQNPPPDKTW